MSSSSKTPEYCGKRENTLHSQTSDLVFHCCGQCVLAYLFSASSTISSHIIKPSTITTEGKAKSSVIPPSSNTIIISSPITLPTKYISIKIGQSQFTDREIVELYWKGSITKSTIKKKSKYSSHYCLPPSLIIPGRETGI